MAGTSRAMTTERWFKIIGTLWGDLLRRYGHDDVAGHRPGNSQKGPGDLHLNAPAPRRRRGAPVQGIHAATFGYRAIEEDALPGDPRLISPRRQCRVHDFESGWTIREVEDRAVEHIVVAADEPQRLVGGLPPDLAGRLGDQAILSAIVRGSVEMCHHRNYRRDQDGEHRKKYRDCENADRCDMGNHNPG